MSQKFIPPKRPLVLTTPAIPPKRFGSVIVEHAGKRYAFMCLEDAVSHLTRAWASEVRADREKFPLDEAAPEAAVS